MLKIPVKIRAEEIKYSKKSKKWELFYLPFYCFSVSYSSKSKRRTLFFLVDALKGKCVTCPEEVLKGTVEVKEQVKVNLSEEEALAVVEKESLFPHGIFTLMRRERVKKVGLTLYPFWVFYVDRGGHFSIKIADAVTGRKENHFAAEIIAELLIKEGTF